jgi:DNA-binding NtrC family response regulator
MSPVAGIDTILIVEDDATLNRLLSTQLRASGYAVVGASCWREAQQHLAGIEPSLVLLDINLPDANGLEKIAELSEICPVIVLTAYGSIDQAVAAIKCGGADYLTKPVSPDALDLALRRTLAARSMRRDYEYLRRQVDTAAGRALIGRSTAMVNLRNLIGVVGPSDTTVLILGESGVGKELVAAAVHQASNRASSNFVAVDCSTLQSNLFESELFGHERGAFTGADRRKEGLIEVAAGGTVFLDEIGETPLSMQAKLLRVLESGRFRRVGGTKDISANVRFVTATNRDLEAMCRAGTFREDLYYRLSAFVLKVPPLRERLDDIPLLAEHFLQTRDFARHAHKRWSQPALGILMGHDWPGNVRELRNIVERAALISGSEPEIRPGHVGSLRRQSTGSAKYVFSFDTPPKLDDLAEVYLRKLIAEGDRSRAEVASMLGVSERKLYRMLNALEEKETTR